MHGVSCKAAILDLDGVLTRTASLHARAWKATFDHFLAQRDGRAGENFTPFDIHTDYLRYVDGKPRFDGVRDFLASRRIDLPEGDADASAGDDTVRGLGMRKDARFLALLDQEGVEVFDDAVEQVRRWRDRGMATALITSSRNGRLVLNATGLTSLFDEVIDGQDAERLGIAGKPAPDIFLHAARALGVQPAEAIVVEDAIAGVQAARAGGFGLVVGVARGRDEGLREAGADVVVADLREWDTAAPSTGDDVGAGAAPVSALEHLGRITDRLANRQLALFLDYDGTLTPIVRRPEDAVLSDEMRALLQDLASRVTVAIISGRDLPDVRKMVALDTLYYAGSHGFDVAGPGNLRMQQQLAQDHLPDLDEAEREVGQRVRHIEGAWVERKRFAIAVHYRDAAEQDVSRVERAVDDVRAAHPRLRKKAGKCIFELQPDVPWDKGRAVRWLLQQLDLAGPDVLPMYVGDDVTDEDAFDALSEDGVGIRVGLDGAPTRARFLLQDTEEMGRFLRALLERLGRQAADRG
jgi:trehalose-phosphatase